MVDVIQGTSRFWCEISMLFSVFLTHSRFYSKFNVLLKFKFRHWILLTNNKFSTDFQNLNFLNVNATEYFCCHFSFWPWTCLKAVAFIVIHQIIRYLYCNIVILTKLFLIFTSEAFIHHVIYILLKNSDLTHFHHSIL